MDFTTMVLYAELGISLTIGVLAGRLFGCSQCRAVRDQEITLVKRLQSGDRELRVQRHRLRRNRPFTAAEMIEVLLANGLILSAERWDEIEERHQRYGTRPLPRHRHGLDEFTYDPRDDVADELPVPR